VVDRAGDDELTLTASGQWTDYHSVWGSGEMRISCCTALIFAAGLLAGCTMLNSTAVIDPGDALVEPIAGARPFGGTDNGVGERHTPVSARFDAAEDPVRCRGKLGVYYLTKRLIPIKLTRKGKTYTLYTGGEAAVEGVPTSGLITTSDRRRGYCLDFLESATSDDFITVDRDEKGGYLTMISSEARDQSAAIAKTVIKTIFTAITGAPDFDESETGGDLRALDADERPVDVFKAKYDPTDPVETALINQRLGQAAGLCLVLEGQPPISIDDYAAYCDNPMAYIDGPAHRPTASPGRSKEPWSAHVLEVQSGPRMKAAVAKYNGRAPIAEHEMDAPGIYYRPRRPFTYSILVRQSCRRQGPRCTGAGGRSQRPATGEWALREEKTIELENLSPIMAIRVDRTFFATRKTVMQFDDGVLYDVKIRKDSELAGFVEIPLQIVKSVVAIPGNLVKVRFDNTQSRTRLVAAQMLLMQQQTDYLKAFSGAAGGE
jgi:hypothetical protein